MFSPGVLFLIILCYLCLLFGMAYYAEARERSGRSIVSNPYVYSLSIAVYCTSWTYYGSVGKAASTGLTFITIYLGPTLVAALWWVVLRKIVVIAKENRLTTLSDFIGSRYGKSLALSAIVTVIALVGITPYLGLQIKAITGTFEIMSGGGGQAAGWVIALIVGVFAVIFGARRLDASERHEGLVFAVAFESIIKLAGFMLAGAFVTYGLFDGFGDIFERISRTDYSGLLGFGGDGGQPGIEWASLVFLSMMAVMFLPRQFHVAVVENSRPGHIKKAMWLFPLYLVLINVFVLPVAFGGLLLGGSPSGADSFLLTIPLGLGRFPLALLVFLGGFSAATGMIIVESLALSTMVMNSLVMPVVYRFNGFVGFPAIVLNIKRLVIIGCVFLGYFFAASVGEFYSLVDMGLTSFVAVSLFAPSLLIGLYWKDGNRLGAAAGLVAGFAVWLYTLFVPALARAGLISEGGLLGRALGSTFSSVLGNPSALFGLSGMGAWTHALFWSMAVNVTLYVGVSLFTRQTVPERVQAILFVEQGPSVGGAPVGGMADAYEVESLLGQYIGEGAARAAVDGYLRGRGLARDGLDEQALAGLRDEAEKILSGSLGPAIATLVFRKRLVLTEELSSSIMQMTTRLQLSRDELEEAYQQLSFLKEFSENIIESVPVGLATLDRDMRVTYWNSEMERMTGISRALCAGKPVGSLPICAGGDVFAAAIAGGEAVCSLASEAGTSIRVTVSPLNDPKGGHIVMFEDITDKLRHEKELLMASKYASIGKLTAGISHEIGNPLASISSLIQEMQALDEPGFSKSAAATVNEHIGRIARIVRNLGDFARISSPEMVKTDLGGILDRTLGLMQFDKKFRKVRLVRELADVPPVRVNPDHIQQVFLNLVLNALDAMPEGGTIFIGMKVAGEDLEIKFSDDGEGMDYEALEHVFDPFFTTKPPGKGTGLGMSVCYGIIKEHGGTIFAESEKGKGATFTIRLPLGA